MKKFVVCILSAVLVLSLAACSGNSGEVPTPTTRDGDISCAQDGTMIPSSDPKTWGPSEDGENAQIHNPWQACGSLEEAGKLAGFSFMAPDTVDGFSETYIAAIENEIAEVIFSNGEADDSALYFRKGMETEDISGDYNSYETVDKQTIGDRTVTCKGNDGLVYTAIWNDGTYSYAVMSNAGMNAEQLTNWVQSLS